jgi:hypothetical protein
MYQTLKYCFVITFLLTNFVLSTYAQKTDLKPESFPFIYATYSVNIPGGDLSDRFGVGSDVGGGVGYKTSRNWVWGAEATYSFGSNVKENTIADLVNSDNQITNMYGEPSQVNMRQAGMQIKATFGKIIPVLPNNNNSGIYLRGGIGFLQHKIFIDNYGNNTPQIMGDYRKGYDRLTNGAALSEFIGWQNFANEGAYHFLVGFEFVQAITENRRTWDYATNQKLDGLRLDLLYSFKVAWFIPYRQRQSAGYFYY